MDQTTSAHQELLRHFRERLADSNLDRHLVYVLVAIVKKELHLEGSLYRMLQICSVTLFEKTPISQALSLADDQTDLDHLCKQLILFN
jgi:hypothetical protein